MSGTLWGWISAAFGLAIMILAIVHGLISGTWVDEHSAILTPADGPAVPYPSLIPAVCMGAIGVALAIGGLITGLSGGTGRSTRRAQPASAPHVTR